MPRTARVERLDLGSRQHAAALAAISKAAIFSHVPAEGHRFLADHSLVRSYDTGTVIVVQGTRGGSIFGVLSGRLRTLKFSPQGRRLILSYMGRGDWGGHYWTFGELGAMMDVDVTEKAVCIHIPGDRIREAGRRWPTLYEGLYLEHIRTTLHLYPRLELGHAQPLPVRVAAVLVAMLERYSTSSAAELRLEMPMSQAELASITSCSRPRLNQVLREWAERGILSTVGRKALVVHDLKALRAIAKPSASA